MPTYDYSCPNGHTFERFERMGREPERPCPECGATARRQVSGGAGLLVRGRGAGPAGRGRTLDGGSTSGEPPHAPPDLTRRRS